MLQETHSEIRSTTSAAATATTTTTPASNATMTNRRNSTTGSHHSDHTYHLSAEDESGQQKRDLTSSSTAELNNNIYLETAGETSTDDDALLATTIASQEEESDPHLERVQVELDRLNYSNESINNLELELEEAKREYLRLMQSTDEQLTTLERKLGSCVDKSRPYYESRIDLAESKHKYLTAKHRFETAQELYVAAKNMQMYAEENLENSSGLISSSPAVTAEASSIFTLSGQTPLDKDQLLKILEIARIKVNDTELSKQSSDAEQIEALKAYEEKRGRVELLERQVRKFVDKSRRYYELKSRLYKELRFVFTKIEGLRSCVKEAKLCYQQSLRNLETISTEIHTQRNSLLVSRGSGSEAIEQLQGEFLKRLYTKITTSHYFTSDMPF
jgi:hypothetical protein